MRVFPNVAKQMFSQTGRERKTVNEQRVVPFVGGGAGVGAGRHVEVLALQVAARAALPAARAPELPPTRRGVVTQPAATPVVIWNQQVFSLR